MTLGLQYSRSMTVLEACTAISTTYIVMVQADQPTLLIKLLHQPLS